MGVKSNSESMTICLRCPNDCYSRERTVILRRAVGPLWVACRQRLPKTERRQSGPKQTSRQEFPVGSGVWLILAPRCVALGHNASSVSEGVPNDTVTCIRCYPARRCRGCHGDGYRAKRAWRDRNGNQDRAD